MAIVTGASSGIGKATALRLAADGLTVVGVGRDEAALKAVCQDSVVADVTKAGAPTEIVSGVLARHGRVDVLVNAAGVIASAGVRETTDEAFDSMMDLNLRATFRLLREVTPALVESKGTVAPLSVVMSVNVPPPLRKR